MTNFDVYARLQHNVIVAANNWRNHPEHSNAIKELQEAVDAFNEFLKTHSAD